MKIDKFLSSMLPSFEKTRVKEDIGLLREELKEVVLPVYDSAVKAMKKRDFRAEPIIAFNNDFTSSVKTATKGNFIVVIHESMRNAYENLDMLEVMIDKFYSDDVMRDGMTYLRINLLQYLEAISFASRFSRAILLWTYAAEISAVGEEYEGDEISEGEREWINKNSSTFFQCINIIGLKKKDIEKKLEEIPDVVATEENNQFIPRTIGKHKLDPFHFDLIPVKLNPIYHVRMLITEWQVARHRAAMEEKRMLEFRLLQMKQIESGKDDAKLQERIEYTEGRLQKLRYKLQEMEEEYV